MALTRRGILSGLAAVVAVAGVGSVHGDAGARDFLRAAMRAAARHTTCPATADDVVAEAALRLIAAREEGLDDPCARHPGYVRRAVANVFRDLLRRRERVRPESDLGEETEVLAGRTSALPAADELAELEEFRACLAPRDRAVLELLEEGLIDRQIAVRLGRTRHDVRQSVARIRRRAGSYFGCPPEASALG